MTLRTRSRCLLDSFALCLALAGGLAVGRQVLAAGMGRIEFELLDDKSGNVTPCRIHLIGSDDKPVKPIDLAHPYWRDHFVCPGTASVKVPAGEYRYEIDRGPEYRLLRNKCVVAEDQIVQIRETLERIVDLANEGWWSGELHIHRPLKEIPLHLRAEDLHAGVAITWWNDKSEWKNLSLPMDPVTVVDRQIVFDSMGGEDERGGGAILISGLKSPLPISGSKRESPPSLNWLKAAKDAGAWVDAEKPFWWDFPVWLSSGRLDSVGIANNHMNRGGMYPGGEAWGRARDRAHFPEPTGNGYWTQAIYYHALNSGFRLPPSAGSASGVLPNPVGYNRMYVHLHGEFTWDKWWSGFRAGRVFVTNGPMLRLTAQQHHPGHTFLSKEPIELTIDGQIDSRDAVAGIELITNGHVERLQSLPTTVKIAESGWFLVRIIADIPNNFRFASTAPWYVEIGGNKLPARRESCEFFREWTNERIDSLRQKLASDEERREVLPVFETASRFWTNRSASAIP